MQGKEAEENDTEEGIENSKSKQGGNLLRPTQKEKQTMVQNGLLQCQKDYSGKITHSQGKPDTRKSPAIRTSTQTIQGLTEEKEARISGGPR